MTNLPAAWSPNYVPNDWSKSETGRKNILTAVKTDDQRVTGTIRLLSTQLQGRDSANRYDYYAVTGSMAHDVQNFRKNAVSVGYYATYMNLRVALPSDVPGCIFDSGPETTVGQNTTSFSIGASLGGQLGKESNINAGVSASFGTSFTSSDVKIGQSQQDRQVSWQIDLPKVGFSSPGAPDNPFAASSDGYKWEFGLIVQVPAGTQLRLDIYPSYYWRFDYTRGIEKHKIEWHDHITHVHTAPNVVNRSVDFERYSELNK